MVAKESRDYHVTMRLGVAGLLLQRLQFSSELEHVISGNTRQTSKMGKREHKLLPGLVYKAAGFCLPLKGLPLPRERLYQSWARSRGNQSLEQVVRLGKFGTPAAHKLRAEDQRQGYIMPALYEMTSNSHPFFNTGFRER